MLILVVDDDAFAAEMTAAIVEEAGYEFLMVENGLEALEVMENKSIDLVLSDMHMPLMSGIELFNELREQGVQVPFILLSGDEPEVALSLEPRLDASILKDFSLPETLPASITQVMTRCA